MLEVNTNTGETQRKHASVQVYKYVTGANPKERVQYVPDALLRTYVFNWTTRNQMWDRKKCRMLIFLLNDKYLRVLFVDWSIFLRHNYRTGPIINRNHQPINAFSAIIRKYLRWHYLSKVLHVLCIEPVFNVTPHVNFPATTEKKEFSLFRIHLKQMSLR